MTSIQKDAELEKFLNGRITHQYHTEAFDKLVHMAAKAPKGSIINVIGPTGVGKTTLLEHFKSALTEEVMKSENYTPSDLPVVMIEARAPDAKVFTWNGFYRSAIETMLEFSPDRKCCQEDRTHNLLRQKRVITYELRTCFEDTIKKRNVGVFIVDEAQHIAIGAGRKEILKHLEVLKSLANFGETVIVLAGVYELVDFRNLSGQLSRRTIDVHFPRYRPDKPEDVVEFASIVTAFEARMPFPCSPPLSAIIKDLYAGSVGCIGILKEWLNRSLKDAAREKSKLLTMTHLNNNVLQFDQLKKIYLELKAGEPKMATNPHTLENMRKILGLDQAVAAKVTTKKTDAMESSTPSKKLKLKPFEMKPHRFPTGSLSARLEPTIVVEP